MTDAAEIALTFDIDWAPDWAIDLTAGILREREVRATWFVTHESPAVDRLREDSELFELGIHPNFLPGSTQARVTGKPVNIRLPCGGQYSAAVDISAGMRRPRSV